MRFNLFLIGILVTAAAGTATAQEPKAVSITISEPAQVSIEKLYAQADLVAFVKIRAGDAENYQQTIYKAEVLRAFKGSSVDDVIYFVPFIGYGLGSEYLVFLKRAGKRIAEIVDTDVRSFAKPFDPAQPFFRIMYEGYSIMEVSYECGIGEPMKCDYVLTLVIDQVTLPQTVKVYPAEYGDPDITTHKYVRRDDVEALLSKIARTGKP